MRHHEQRSFWKFFSAYFGSVALLILVAGHLYYQQQYEQHIKDEHFAIINYARQLKMHEPTAASDITHSVVMKQIDNFTMNTLTVTPDAFEKYIPANRQHTHYLLIKKDRSGFDRRIQTLQTRIIAVQLTLLALFALISLLLTNSALRPMREALSRLDRFTKDLIHDLNTPLTTIKLNLKLLDKEPSLAGNKAVQRIKKSGYEISELHENLKVLLEEETFQLEALDVCRIVGELAEDYATIYTRLHFTVTCTPLQSQLNKNALKRAK